jgi:hypothetical protein
MPPEENAAGPSSVNPKTQPGLQETIRSGEKIIEGARNEDELDKLKPAQTGDTTDSTATDAELHSFPYSETIDGIEHNYRITENHDRYGIERDGIVVAEVSHDDQWQQLAGEPLDPQLLESICYHIEAPTINP